MPLIGEPARSGDALIGAESSELPAAGRSAGLTLLREADEVEDDALLAEDEEEDEDGDAARDHLCEFIEGVAGDTHATSRALHMLAQALRQRRATNAALGNVRVDAWR